MNTRLPEPFRSIVSIIPALVLCSACVAIGCATDRSVPEGAASAAPGSPTLSGPYAHENLAVFFVHGQDRLAGRKLVALEEALREKKVVVHETRSVNRLEVENVSGDPVFVQAGDIVKGGQQDRVLAVDLVVPPHSGKLAVGAFCVEHGRWSRRGSEPPQRFSGSRDSLATKKLKLAARRSKRQNEVWAEVNAAQRKLQETTGAAAVDGASPSSMQLTMEAPVVEARVDPYLERLATLPDGKADVIGCAFAVNGRLTSADLYASPTLFRALWPKLLRASAVEAMTEAGAPPQAVPRFEAVRAFVGDSPTDKPSEEEIGGRMKLTTVEREDAVRFDSRDRDRKDGWLRRSIVAKDANGENPGNLR